MAWGSSEEQKQEHEAGNPNAKDWHDKALQVIERMMEEWNSQPMTNTSASDLSPDKQASDKHVLESEYDCHCCELHIKTVISTDTSGWKAELCC